MFVGEGAQDAWSEKVEALRVESLDSLRKLPILHQLDDPPTDEVRRCLPLRLVEPAGALGLSLLEEGVPLVLTS